MLNRAHALAVFLAATVMAASAQSAPVTCSTEIVAQTQLSASQRSLTEQRLNQFFSTFDESCSNNAEYGEFSNSVLFEVAADQPELLLKVLEHHDQRALILKEFADPVNDWIKIPLIQDTINRAEGPAHIKKAVLRSLTRARQRT